MASASPWDNPSYYWVVICKNKRFHHHANQWAGHKVVLGETDAIAPLPEVGKSVPVRCDECGQEYSYEPKEVLRLEMQHPESFITHPQFLEQQKAGLRRDAVRSQVIDALEAQEIQETGNEED